MRGRSIIPVEQCPIASEEVNAKLAEVSQQRLENIHLTIRNNSGGEVRTFTESWRPRRAHRRRRFSARSCEVPLGSFFQVNREVIELALEHARQIFAASGCKILVDAYCGVGLFALLLADLAEHVYGIEDDKKAIEAANDNAVRLGLARYDFYPGKTERLLFYTLRQCNLDKTCLILDPPRSGCGKPV